MHFLHCIKDIITTILTDLLFSTEEKCGSGPADLALHRQKRVPVLREGFINFPARVRFGQKGFLCAAKRSFFPDCRVPDLEGKGLL